LTVHRINLFKISTWIVPVQNIKEKENLKIGEEEYDNKAYTHNFTFRDKLKIIYVRFNILQYKLICYFSHC